MSGKVVTYLLDASSASSCDRLRSLAQHSAMSADGRRVVRQRKVSTRVAAVTDTDRRNAANARLEALETDHDAAPIFQDSDEEFVLSESEEGELPLHDAHARFASRDS